MNFAREKFDDALIRDVEPLLLLHYKEIAHYQDIELSPNFEQYKQAEAAGLMRVYTARDEANTLTAYAVFFVKHNLHYQKSLQAAQDVIFVDPARRGFGAKFIAYCDEQLKLEGVQAVYHHVKQAHNFGPLLEKQGYQLIDLIYAKRLDLNG